MKKFTFKKTIPEGRYRSFERDHTKIKLNKNEVGYITEIEYNMYKVYFAVKKEKTEKNPASFKWTYITKIFNSEKQAREYVRERNDIIQRALDLHQFEA